MFFFVKNCRTTSFKFIADIFFPLGQFRTIKPYFENLNCKDIKKVSSIDFTIISGPDTSIPISVKS